MDKDRPELEYVALVKRAFPEMLDLFAAGDEVLQLLTHPGWARVLKVIDLSLADSDEMLDGRLLDSRADYARAHGRRSGLRSMTEAARAIVGHANSELTKQRNKHEAAAEPAAR